MKSIVTNLLSVLLMFSGVNTPAQEGPATTARDAAKGVPALQEVVATGTGLTEDEAFKQAIVDAVRRVVGTLVSAENVVKNDRVIKDEVLTLSNGFVEKVLNQDKTKMDDGTWQVKLKCIVRKGQLYGKLQGAKIPTIKLEGESLFGDVVSQLSVEKDAAALLRRALLGWNGNIYEAVSLSSKPEIRRGEDDNFVDIIIPCRLKLRRAVYESQFLSKITNLFETIAVEKVDLGKGLDQDQLKAQLNAFNYFTDNQMAIFLDAVARAYVFDLVTYNSIVSKAGANFSSGGGKTLDLFAVFRDSSGACVSIDKFDYSYSGLAGADWWRTGAQCFWDGVRKLHISPEFYGLSEFKFDFHVLRFPVKRLKEIAKIELHVATGLGGQHFTRKHLPFDAPGFFLDEKFCLHKATEKDRSNRGDRDIFYYLPTLQMEDGQYQKKVRYRK